MDHDTFDQTLRCEQCAPTEKLVAELQARGLLKVTDAMVQSACLAYGGDSFPHRMRIALECVIPTTPQGE